MAVTNQKRYAGHKMGTRAKPIGREREREREREIERGKRERK